MPRNRLGDANLNIPVSRAKKILKSYLEEER